MHDLVIRDASDRDIDRLEELEKLCFSMPWTKEQLISQLPDDMHVFLAADIGGEMAGYVGMMHVVDEGYISNVAVAPEYRRRGIADALISALIARCEALALAFVTLEVRRGNAGAVALYKKHGFLPVGERKDYYELPREDALLMTKFFKRGMEIENTII